MGKPINHKYLVYDNLEKASEALAQFIVTQSNLTNDIFSIALSGGNTPIYLYKLLTQPPYSNNINWKKIYCFIVDERYVSISNEENNYRMLNKILFSKIPIPLKNIFKINTNTTPEKDAMLYALKIKNNLNNLKFDLVLLGLGNDGHTASLFPNHKLLKEKKKLVAEEFIAEKKQFRISLTLPIINKAKQICFLVSGTNKANVFYQIKNGINTVPASLVNNKKQILFFLDNTIYK